VNAEIVRQTGKLGELVPGAFADLLVVEGIRTGIWGYSAVMAGDWTLLWRTGFW
jgi:hypothetical protein